MSKLIWKPGNLIAPVPAAMVSCGSMEKPNIITVAWTGNICSGPARAYISVRPERFSYGLIKESREFVINLTTAALVRAADFCGVRSGREVDKFAQLGLTPLPAREVACHPEAAAFAAAGLERLGIPYTTGKTWTTDALYRETPALVEARRDEGCLTVEMEAAAFFAVSQYHGIPLAQLLYAGDDVSGESWDSRRWDSQRGVRWDLIQTAIRLTEDFPIKQQGE